MNYFEQRYLNGRAGCNAGSKYVPSLDSSVQLTSRNETDRMVTSGKPAVKSTCLSLDGISLDGTDNLERTTRRVFSRVELGGACRPLSLVKDSQLKTDLNTSVCFDASDFEYKSPLSGLFMRQSRPQRKPLIDQVPWPDARVEVSKTVSLIKTIPQELHPRVERMMIRVFRGHSSREGLIAWLVEKGGVSEARARLIADDQMAKISEALLRIKWRRRGIEYVKWVHGGSSEPRDYHLADWDGTNPSRPNGLNGLVFPIDQPPVIDTRTGQRGYPGDLVGCTCHLEPVVLKRKKPATAKKGRKSIAETAV